MTVGRKNNCWSKAREVCHLDKIGDFSTHDNKDELIVPRLESFEDLEV